VALGLLAHGAYAETARPSLAALSAPEAPACVGIEDLSPGEIETYYRFGALPHGFATWRERNCFPPRLEAEALARTPDPVGTIVSVAGRDAVVVDPGTAWLIECSQAGQPAVGIRGTSGADLVAVIDRIARHPGFSGADIREVGVSMGEPAEGDEPIYALLLGTPRALVRVQCFRDVAALVDRAAEALGQAP
jgi:hypothetical protein